MITEDYVSFEVAKLLKEKGFDGICQAYYDNHGFSMFNGKGDNYETRPSSILAPTLQMAMKWLREVHNIYINLDIHWLDFANSKGWMYVIEIILENGVEFVDCKGDESDKTFYLTYEQAVEAAIKYCLENLI